MKKPIFSLLLCFSLLVGLLPTTVFAAGTDKAVQLGSSQIKGGQASSVYFGNYPQSDATGNTKDPVKWRVLSDADGTLFLLSDQNLDAQPYNTSNTSITWENCTLRTWLNGTFLTAAFSNDEQGAIAQTYVDNADNPTYNTPGGNDTTDKIFLLSIEEANNSSYFPNEDSRISINNAYVASLNTSMSGAGAEDWWWLRSPGDSGDSDNRAAIMNDEGSVIDIGRAVDDTYYAVRPAFNLDLSSILFTSAADNSGHISFGTALPDYSGSEWKVTLKDSNDFSSGASVSGTTSLMAGYSDTTLTINHAALSSLSGDYTDVTAALTDTNGSLLYYGSINSDTSATESTVTIPAGLSAGTYTLSIYGEDWNNEKCTDFATGTPYTVTLTVDNTPQQYTVTFDTTYGTVPASMTVTEGTSITLPELEDDGDYIFAGWWIIDSPYVNFYSAGEEYTVTKDVTCIADWDEIVTLTAPFTTTVELGDSGVPGETVFTLEIMFMGEVDEDMYQDMTISASVTTNGKGEYDGAMTFTGRSQQLKSMLRQGVYVQQVNDSKENWTYDDAVWYLDLMVEPEIHALAAEDDTVSEYKLRIFQATREETEYGPVYGMDWENTDWDNPEAKMLFTNTYTAHDYTLKHNETGHWDECGCGDVQNREAHRYGEWTVTKEATKTESGKKDRTCTICGYTQTAEIEKLPDAGKNPDTGATTSPDTGTTAKPNTDTTARPDTGTGSHNTNTSAQSPLTGDNSNMALWIFLIFVAGAALVGTAIYVRKKKS